MQPLKTPTATAGCFEKPMPNLAFERDAPKSGAPLNFTLGIMKLKRLLIAAALVLAGCSDSKLLPGGFELQKWEDGTTYYLNDRGKSEQNGGGVIEGTVIRLAWNTDIIAADRYSTFRGDRDGWMIIDTRTKQITGPISEDEFAQLQVKYHLQVRTAEDAWAAL